jgi:hypothetical protein
MGGGVLTTDAQTNTSGIAVVSYTAGMAQGLSTLRAEAVGRWTSTTVWQGSAATGPAAIAAADGRTRDNIARLQGLVSASVIGPPAPPAPAPVIAAAPPVAAAPEGAAAPPVAAAPEGAAAPPVAAAPVATPTPGAPAAVAAAPAAAAAPRAPSDGSIDLTAGIAVVKHSYQQLLQGKSSTVPPDVGFDRPGSPGLDLRAVYWTGKDKPLGVAAGIRFYRAAVDLSGQLQDFTAINATAGLRYRGTLSDMDIGWIGMADMQYVTVPVITFTSAKQTKAEITTLGLPGVRLGAGLTKAIKPVLLDAVLAQTFAPSPIDTRIGLGAAYPVKEGLNARLGLDVDLRSGTVQVDQTELEVSETELAITIGITTSL